MNKLVKFLAVVALSAAAAVAFALPTSEAVQAVIKKGDYAQAETMMQEVVTAKPNSAKAHYLYAEILAHNTRFDQASVEARMARQLDSQISFTDPAKFAAFEQMLEREQSAKVAARSNTTRSSSVTPSQAPRQMAPAPAERSSGMPGWVWGLGFAVVAFVIYRVVTSRRAPPAMGGYPANGGYPAAPGAAPGYGGYPGGPMGGAPMGGGGSGLLGAGLAGAGGFAAGMLAEKLMTGGSHQQDLGNSGGAQVANNGGLVPGMFDNSDERNAAQALEDRPMDFGNGNDWGGDAGSSGGDGGGSSSSDDGW